MESQNIPHVHNVHFRRLFTRTYTELAIQKREKLLKLLSGRDNPRERGREERLFVASKEMETDFRVQRRREETFQQGWSHVEPSVQEMAEAGFIFTGEFSA